MRAEWAMWCLFGPDATKFMLALNSQPPHQQRADLAKWAEAQTLAIADPPFTAALYKAVANGNMPVREGLTLALKRAYETETPILEALNHLAQSQDLTTRACAKAALREIAATPK